MIQFQRTFRFNSHFWSDRNAYNLVVGKTGFDQQETKLPTYWSTHFSKICRGMRIGHQLKFVVVYKQANSLFSLIAEGKYRATSLGRNTWKKLIGSQASLQPYCNREGFNAISSTKPDSKARIGIVSKKRLQFQWIQNRFWHGRVFRWVEHLWKLCTPNKRWWREVYQNDGKHTDSLKET